VINTLNAKLNSICHLLALLGAHHILHVSRIRVKHLPGGWWGGVVESVLVLTHYVMSCTFGAASEIPCNFEQFILLLISLVSVKIHLSLFFFKI